MSRPDEGLIHAWLDGELEPAEAERVKRLSETEPEWAAAVAEARGLVAASSRIVRALDAVPGGVVPATTARAPRARQAFRVRPWMGIAAGLVLVVGTAYMTRESTEQAFGPTTDASVPVIAEVTVPTAAAASASAAPQDAATSTLRPAEPAPVQLAPVQPAVPLGERREATAPTRDQAVGPLRQTADDATRIASGAGSTGVLGPLPTQSAPAASAPSTVSPAPTPSTASPALASPAREPARTLAPSAPPPPSAAGKAAAAEDDRSLARARISSERLNQVVVTGSYGPETPAATLAGCWRVSAPDSLAALYRDLTIVRAAGDTLELLLRNTRMVLVVRDRDTLRGALTAIREVCPPRP